jgi:hypothetical protein
MLADRAARWLARLSVVCSVGIVAAVALPTASIAETSTAGNQGLQDGWAIGDDGSNVGWHFLADEFPFMQEAGAGWVRINFRLGSCFRDWTTRVTQADIDAGQCDPSTLGKRAQDQYDAVVSNALAHNLKVLGLLSNESWNGSPDKWRANSAEQKQGNGDNPYIADFASKAAGLLAGHFDGSHGPAVAQWEIWNEPNATNDQPDNGTFVYPSNFAWMLSRSYAAIKSVNAQATVVSGGVLGLDQDTLRPTSLRTYAGQHNARSSGSLTRVPARSPVVPTLFRAAACTSARHTSWAALRLPGAARFRSTTWGCISTLIRAARRPQPRSAPS